MASQRNSRESTASDVERFWRGVKPRRVSIDLFAGSGGLSLGLQTVGWEGLFAVEKDPMAFDTLSANFLTQGAPFKGFPDWPTWLSKTPLDITTVLNDRDTFGHLRRLRGTVDLIVGGPPCQGFSVGGARRGEKDPRNDLPFRFVDFVDAVQPKSVILENVEGFDKPFAHQGHRKSYADVVADEFRTIGYVVFKRLIHAVNHGVPQTRRRVVLVAFRSNLIRGVSATALGQVFDYLLEEEAGALQSTWLFDTDFPIGVKAALDDLSGSRLSVSPDAPKFKTSHYLAPKSNYARLMRAFVNGPIPDSHRIPVHTEKVDSLIRTAQATQTPGRLPQDFLRRMGTRSRKKVLLDPNQPSSTLTSHPDEFFHYRLARIVTLRETARLQSFPDSFVFRGRYTLNGDRRGLDVSRCAQVGNAIPPLLGRALGLTLHAMLDAIESRGLSELQHEALMRSGQMFAV